MIDFEKTKKKLLNNPKVKEEYDRQKPEFIVARALIEARTKANMTQQDVAKKMRTSQSQIARLESGDHLPSIASIHKYAKAIDRKISIEITAH